MKSILITIGLLLLVVPAEAQTHYFHAPVNDEASILTDTEEADLNAMMRNYMDTADHQFAVLTVSSLGGQDIESYTNEVANAWGGGSAQNDNGMLLLIALNDRKMRIEVGEGLEGELTDAFCSRVIRNVLTPHFRESKYYEGIKIALNDLMLKANGLDVYEIEELASHGLPTWVIVLLWVLGIALVISAFVLYRKWRRNRPRVSKKTGMPMARLDEKADDEHLTPGQRTEERIGSVDYDVWITDDGDDLQIIAYKKWFSKYSRCPKCRYKAYYRVYRHTVVSPTYSSSGRGEQKHSCMHCKHSKVSSYTIPRLQRSSSSSGGSSGGGWSSGGGGGGWSGGGGSFGGGGASGSW